MTFPSKFSAILAMALTLAGTAGCTSKSQEVASVNVTPGIAAESLQGMYDVVRVNGRRTLANFSVTSIGDIMAAMMAAMAFLAWGLVMAIAIFLLQLRKR